MIVSGSSNSRLSELRKYVIGDYTLEYINGGTYSIDGVDYDNSISGVTMIYYLGGIKYIDDVINTGTTFTFTAQGINSADFISVPYYKDPKKENIISNAKINNDVFITRQELSAFDKNYRLEFIRKLIDLETYAGGNFFVIVNNT